MPAKAGISVGTRYVCSMRRGSWTDIITSKPHGVLYVGVTASLAQRIAQHRIGEGSAFCRKYNLTMLVHAEQHATIEDAIVREKALKAWKWDWKIALIEAGNPDWRDLAADVVHRAEIPAFAGITEIFAPPTSSSQRKLGSREGSRTPAQHSTSPFPESPAIPIVPR